MYLKLVHRSRCCFLRLESAFSLALLLLLVQAGPVFSTIITPDRVIPWVPGVTVGVRGAIPVRTNLLNITQFGATTNNGWVTGTIAAGDTNLYVSSKGDFAVGQGIWISNVFNPIIAGISNNVFFLSYASPASASGTLVGHDNAPVINSVIQSAQVNDVVYIPSGTFVTRQPIYLQNKSYISLRGANNSVLACLGAGGSALIVGPTSLQGSQAKQFTVTNAVLKGANQLQLASTYDPNQGDVIRVGELYSLTTLNGSDPNFRLISVYGFQRILSQTIRVENISGNLVTFSPPAVWYFTNQPALGQFCGASGQWIGLEGISITLTNNGAAASPYAIGNNVLFQDCSDSWITNCNFSYANNYHVNVSGCVFCEFDGNLMTQMLSAGTSHSGMLLAQSSACLIQNNIWDTVDFALQFWGQTVAGCAVFANLWTNSANQSIIFHNTHHMMNLFEANMVDSSFEMDGYYGSNSHETLLRNSIMGSTYLKRFSSYINSVGNVLGTTFNNFAYDTYNPWPIFEMGYPNIGNHSYSSTSPPMGWNYPQTTFFGCHGVPPYVDETYTNCSFTFTSTLIGVTNLIGNFSNWPFDPYGGYNLVFQDGANTNAYHFLADQLAPGWAGMGLRATQPPTATNMMLNSPVTISNGWTMLVSSADNYQQLQSIDTASDIRHGNYVYTNYTGALVWDPTISDRSIPTSLLYTSGPPSWWGTNRWPAIDPAAATQVTPIPALSRYLGISSGTNSSAENGPTPPTNLRIIGH